MNKFLIIIVAILILGGGFWYFTKSNKQEVQVKTGGVSINIKDFKYNPGSLTVKAGEKITFTNLDTAGHSVTADDGSFDSGVSDNGKSAAITAPTKPGTYNFHCVPHPSIKGTLIVE